MHAGHGLRMVAYLSLPKGGSELYRTCAGTRTTRPTALSGRYVAYRHTLQVDTDNTHQSGTDEVAIRRA